MQVASRQCLWDDTGFGTEVEVEMTPETGLFIRFGFWFAEERPVKVRWGDGSVAEERTYRSGDVYVDHTFRSYGRYHVLFENVRGLGFRVLDGQPQFLHQDVNNGPLQRGSQVFLMALHKVGIILHPLLQRIQE